MLHYKSEKQMKSDNPDQDVKLMILKRYGNYFEATFETNSDTNVHL